jgi:hypothetical protein
MTLEEFSFRPILRLKHIPILCLGSLAVMAIWPLLGTLMLRSSFEQPTDAFFFFGGLTLFPLMILAIFGSFSEQVHITIILLVWLAAVVVPVVWYRRSMTSWRAIGRLLGAQSAFSLGQAVMGALLMLGRSV